MEIISHKFLLMNNLLFNHQIISALLYDKNVHCNHRTNTQMYEKRCYLDACLIENVFRNEQEEKVISLAPNEKKTIIIIRHL